VTTWTKARPQYLLYIPRDNCIISRSVARAWYYTRTVNNIIASASLRQHQSPTILLSSLPARYIACNIIIDNHWRFCYIVPRLSEHFVTTMTPEYNNVWSWLYSTYDTAGTPQHAKIPQILDMVLSLHLLSNVVKTFVFLCLKRTTLQPVGALKPLLWRYKWLLTLPMFVKTCNHQLIITSLIKVLAPSLLTLAWYHLPSIVWLRSWISFSTTYADLKELLSIAYLPLFAW